MADQSVRVTNLPDSGSPEAVAFELWKYLRPSSATADDQLQFYVKCRQATYGYGPKDS